MSHAAGRYRGYLPRLPTKVQWPPRPLRANLRRIASRHRRTRCAHGSTSRDASHRGPGGTMITKQISRVVFGAAAALTCAATAAVSQSPGTSNADKVAQYATDKLKS